MREIRQSGSEGGESDLPYPYSAQVGASEASGGLGKQEQTATAL